MDAKRPGGEMSDAALDRDLESMLAVDPSPDFTARVRTRVASESHRSAWRGAAWMFSAAAAVVVIAVVVPRDRPRDKRGEGHPLASRPLASIALAASDVGRRPALSEARTSGTGGPALRPNRENASPRDTIDEVLVDAREAAAIRALIVAARDGRVDLAPVLNASTPTAMELGPVVEISIPDIAIDPIAPGTGAEGARQ